MLSGDGSRVAVSVAVSRVAETLSDTFVHVYLTNEFRGDNTFWGQSLLSPVGKNAIFGMIKVVARRGLFHFHKMVTYLLYLTRTVVTVVDSEGKTIAILYGRST